MPAPLLVRLEAGGAKAVAAAFLASISRGMTRGLRIEVEDDEVHLSFELPEDVSTAISNLAAVEALEGGLARGACELREDLRRLLDGKGGPPDGMKP